MNEWIAEVVAFREALAQLDRPTAVQPTKTWVDWNALRERMMRIETEEIIAAAEPQPPKVQGTERTLAALRQLGTTTSKHIASAINESHGSVKWWLRKLESKALVRAERVPHSRGPTILWSPESLEPSTT